MMSRGFSWLNDIKEACGWFQASGLKVVDQAGCDFEAASLRRLDSSGMA